MTDETPMNDASPRHRDDSDRRLDELAFLHDIAQLATLARDWDELMRSIVDGTTAAMGVEAKAPSEHRSERTRGA